MSQIANKTANRSLLAWTDVASTAVSIGTPIDVSTAFKIGVIIRIVRKSSSVFTSGSPNIRIEGSVKSSGNNSWAPICTFQPQIGASIAQTTLSSGITAADTTFAVTSATNIGVGDIVFVGDSSTSNYEVFRIKAVSGTTITPEDAAVNNHTNGATVTDQAEIIVASLDIEGFQRVRAVVDNVSSSRDIAVEILGCTLDSVG